MVSKKRIITSVVPVTVAAGALAVAVLTGGGASGKTTLVERVSSTARGGGTSTTAPGPLSSRAARNAPPAQGSVLPPGSPGQSITTAQAALQHLLADKAEVKAVTRSAVKETTWASYLSGSGATNIPPTLQVPGSTKVWVVVVGGTFVPQFAHGNTYSWGAVVYDAATGTPLSSSAGPNGWPGWFASLP